MIDNEIRSLELNNVSTSQLFNTQPERHSPNSFLNLSMEERLELLIQQSIEENKFIEERRRFLETRG
jgi:hypothetical protein